MLEQDVGKMGDNDVQTGEKQGLSRRKFLRLTGDVGGEVGRFMLFTSPGTILAKLGLDALFDSDISKTTTNQQTSNEKGATNNQLAPNKEVNALNNLTQVENKEVNFFPEDPIQVENVFFKVVGVKHDISTFFQHQDEIIRIINKAPFVMLEYFSGRILDFAKPSVTDEELQSQKIMGDRIDAFFGAIGRACARQGKDIIIVNPETGNMQDLEWFFMFGLPSAPIVRAIWNANFSKAVKPKPEQRISRRNLFKAAGAITTAAVWGSWADSLRTKGTNQDESVFRWNLIDYRDVSSAIGISSVLKTYGDEVGQTQTVPLFQGGAHSSGTRKYLKDLELAHRKSVVYPHYNALSKPVARCYYDSSVDKWRLKQFINV